MRNTALSKKAFLALPTSILLFLATEKTWAGSPHLELEIDPIAYALSGYSGHIGGFFGPWKLDLGLASEVFGEKLTQTFSGNSGFSSQFTSYGLKFDFVGKNYVGIHAGMQWDYSQWTYNSTASGSPSASNLIQYVGPRIGYRIGSGLFYIDPWVAILYNVTGAGNIAVGAQSFHVPQFQLFPTLHIGLRF